MIWIWLGVIVCVAIISLATFSIGYARGFNASHHWWQTKLFEEMKTEMRIDFKRQNKKIMKELLNK